MKLDRNINKNGTGKYALLLLRQVSKLDGTAKDEVEAAMFKLFKHGVCDYGEFDETEFFVLRLKDAGAAPALHAYAEYFRNTDPEWSEEVRAMAEKAHAHPDKKQPD